MKCLKDYFVLLDEIQSRLIKSSQWSDLDKVTHNMYKESVFMYNQVRGNNYNARLTSLERRIIHNRPSSSSSSSLLCVGHRLISSSMWKALAKINDSLHLYRHRKTTRGFIKWFDAIRFQMWVQRGQTWWKRGPRLVILNDAIIMCCCNSVIDLLPVAYTI